MPKLWNETVEAHRTSVTNAILDVTGALVAEHGPLSVTMSQIAQEAGIGRATLYKYFPGVEEILVAWHDRQLAGHLEHLNRVIAQGGDARHQLAAALNIHAMMTHEHHGTSLAGIVHGGEAQHRQDAFLQDALRKAADAGAIRDDVLPEELARFCLHSLAAAANAPSKAAVRRLVQLTLDGLRPRP